MFSPRASRRLGGLVLVFAALVGILLATGPPVIAASFANGGFTTSGRTSPSPAKVGQPLTITATVTAHATREALVDVEVFDSTGRRVTQRHWDGQRFQAGRSAQFQFVWTPATAGTYDVRIGVFDPGWTLLRHWNHAAASFSATAPAPATTTTTTQPPVTTTTTAPATTTTTMPPATTPSTTTTTTMPPATTTAPATTTTTTTMPPAPTSTTTIPAAGREYLETFAGSPASPESFTDWYTVVRHRDYPEGTVVPVAAEHDDHCSPPVVDGQIHTHQVTAPAGHSFRCRDHMMTSIDGAEYGALALTPEWPGTANKARIDFSAGALAGAGVPSAVLEFDVSSFVNSGRDWWDVWILPDGQFVKLPAAMSDGIPDPAFVEPRNGIQIKFEQWERNGGSVRYGVEVHVIVNGSQVGQAQTGVGTQTYYGQEYALAQVGGVPDRAIRDKYRLEINRNGLSLTFIPTSRNGTTYEHVYADDVRFPQPLTWDTGTVTFGHHSYNPFKDGQGDHPGTWHWDNIRFFPAS